MQQGNSLALPVVCTALLINCNCEGDPLADVPGQLAVLACNERLDPAEGVGVEVLAPGNEPVVQRSNADGVAQFTLSPRTCSVVFNGGGPKRQVDDVRVEANKTTFVMDEQCVGPRQLAGHGAVAGDLCNRHVGQWVADALVVLTATGDQRRQLRTDGLGHFLFQNVPEGPAVLQIRGPGPFVQTRYLVVQAGKVTWATTATTCQVLGPGDDCTDRDDDGYGAGADCIAPDCEDGDAQVFEGCLQKMPGVHAPAENAGVGAAPRIEVSPAELTIRGLVTDGEAQGAPITIRNVGDDVLVVELPYLAEGPDDARFLVSGVVQDLAPREQAVLTVTAIPGSEPGTLRALLAIPSNDPDRALLKIPLKAHVGQAPGLVMTPEHCEREVGVGQQATCEFVVRNESTAPLAIQALGMAAGSDAGFVVDPLQLPHAIAPGIATTVRVRFTPQTAQSAEGQVQVVSERGQILLGSIHITVAASPHAEIDVESVDGEAVAVGVIPEVRPLADVVLTSARSSAPPGRTLRRRQWRVVERPAESTVVLLSPSGFTTGFGFNSSGVVRRGLDVAGTYVVGLVVTDDAGRFSGEATLTLQSIPGQGIHVQLTWDHAYADMDLHLIRGRNGQFNSITDDCYYANCRRNPQGGPSLLWGAEQESPILDVDDVDGFGPENITVAWPLDNTYQVGVHYFATHQGSMPVPCTVKIFVGSALMGTWSRTLAPSRVFWRVATIELPSARVTPVDQVDVP